MTKKRKGSVSQETFDDFLASQGMLEACEDHAIKDIIAEQLAAAMEEQGITKVEMAARMKTSRRQLDRTPRPGHSVRHARHVAPSRQRGWPHLARRIDLTDGTWLRASID